MTKRRLIATFANGDQITRTTTNDKLAYGWRVTEANGVFVISGFSSTNALNSDAKRVLAHRRDRSFEIVEAVVTAPVKK